MKRNLSQRGPRWLRRTGNPAAAGGREGAGRWAGLPAGTAFISAAAAFTGVGLIIFVLLWFQPQKLFLNKTVNEPVPGVIQTAPAGETNRNPTAGQSPPPGLQVAALGQFPQP